MNHRTRVSIDVDDGELWPALQGVAVVAKDLHGKPEVRTELVCASCAKPEEDCECQS